MNRKKEPRSWYDMTPEEQHRYVEAEACRIAGRHVRKIEAAGKRSEKRVGADDIARRVAGRAAELVNASL